ncbi:hypothetical protein TRFO_11484 [Tritrichomonas foetus]|uniref:Uncharacterized protein n=1 Tax=Tritrichomonas foetus TaxID=1144522 RepID=A0A1J4J3G1_9EUKA|nr:hypothetical protein TRFO_11484 [Tritrichomonas foetus]|eukprot:OHS93992.1 hypothetical protein TRFO_11484 [Tritrichomonas foetus]
MTENIPQKGQRRFPNRILTLNRNDPVPSDNEIVNPILKKKIITYPIPKIEENAISVNEYRNLLKTEHKYNDDIQAQQTIDEIAEFERRNFGKTKVPKPIRIEPLDSMTKQTLDQFKIPNECFTLDYVVPRVRAKTVLSSERAIAKPSTWNTLDEPELPSRRISEKPPVRHKSPFLVTSIHKELKYGIPIYNKSILKINKAKMTQYETKLRYICTCDNQIREEKLKSRVNEDRNQLILKREKQMTRCAELGQMWALKMTGNLPRKPKIQHEIPPSQEDVEAMNFLKERDEEIMNKYKQNKKEMQTQEIASLQNIQGVGI